jgi:hypothetical protein
MCAIDWGLIAAWIGALATVGLLWAARRALWEWKSQFLQTRDHDLALRILRAVNRSHVVFDELRTPHGLFSDSDVAIEPPEAHGPDPEFEYRQMFARYKARVLHLSKAREERTVPLLEALAVWDSENYAVRLGDLINSLAPIESKVIAESHKYVESLRAVQTKGADKPDKSVLYSAMDAAAEDLTNAEYEGIKYQIAEHLKPKIRMGEQ